MVYIAKRRTKKYKNINIEIGSSRKIPFERKFDIIFSSLSFHHWKEKEESLRYLKGFLRKNGEIRIYEYNKSRLSKIHAPISQHSFSKEEFEKIGKSSGMKTKIKISGEFILARFTN
jgi:ubiquinone/menaquinone biosynthesis C-methylase UbiE